MIKRSGIVVALLSSLLALPRPCAAGAYDDDSIKRYFAENDQLRESHGVMAAERERIGAILNYFLVGDFESISTHAREMSDIMRTLVIRQPAGPEEEEKTWKAFSIVISESRSLAAEAERKDYRKAYDHFTKLTAQCIQCHQAARPWGKFPEPVIPADKPRDKAEKTLPGVD